MTLSRRSLITGLISLVAAPAIVRVSSLMPVKALEPEIFNYGGIALVGPWAPNRVDAIRAELEAITRRAFIPRFPVIQIYESSPVLRALMENAK